MGYYKKLSFSPRSGFNIAPLQTGSNLTPKLSCFSFKLQRSPRSGFNIAPLQTGSNLIPKLSCFSLKLQRGKEDFILAFVIFMCSLGMISSIHAQETKKAQVQGLAWDPEVIELAAMLPVQEGGRIKPLDTLARFKLLKLNGRRVCYSLDGKRLSPVEWILDCLFRSDLATDYKIFLVQNNSVLDAVKIPHDGRKKRDRYSYTELVTGRSNLFTLANEYVKIDEKKRDAVQAQIVHLAENMVDFEGLIHYLDFTRETFDIHSIPQLREIFEGSSSKYLTDILKNPEKIKNSFLTLQRNMSKEAGAQQKTEFDHFIKFLSWIDQLSSRSVALALFPPPDTPVNNKEWMTPADIVNVSFSGGAPLDQHIQFLELLKQLYTYRDQPKKFRNKFITFHKEVKELAESRREYSKIPLEVMFYKGQFFYYALLIYILGFLLVAFSWLKPGGRVLNKLIPLTLISGTVFLITGIVLRCLIRSRPPVSTLYETILFITAVSIIVALVVEVINKQKIGLAVGSLLGVIGMFLANKYEIKEGTDTMTSLVAVLDSNYWLSMHVTTVTIGYAAGLLACVTAHAYILGKGLGIKKDNPNFYKGISQMVYGIICFGLLFSVIGTILGGIWANDSWGRFWGWDPKENGALMIILAELAVLHARMGRYIRDLGICMSAIAIGIIVAFSWWGVNLLGVGLHSYGWTSGVFTSLMTYYSLELFVLLVGVLVWCRQKVSAHVVEPTICDALEKEPQKLIDSDQQSSFS